MFVGFFPSFSVCRRFLTLSLISLAIVTGITTGCGSAGSSPSMPKLTGTTSVTILLSSTANDQVTNFDLSIQSLTLTNQSGKTIPMINAASPAEFVHLNGNIEPLTTVTIAQDVYTSATVTLGGAEFVCIEQDPNGGLLFSHYSVVNQGPVVNLASPITVTGSSMVLSLNLQVSDSAILPSCYTDPIFTGYSMSPTFSLTTLAASPSATNPGNGLATGLEATITSVTTTGSSLTLTIPAFSFGTRTLPASANSATVFQGVRGLSGLAPGMFVNMDGALQSDGSLLATRIEVENPSALNVSTGPLISVDTLVPVLMQYGRTQMGPLLTDWVTGLPGQYDESPYFNFSNTTFQISGQFTNLQSLPFVPSFNASNMVAGQNVDITSGVMTLGGTTYTPANTVTLIPQTINGTVEGTSTSGNFTVYTVSLASYDLFPQLAVQPGQTTLLTNPSEVQVYVDSNTQKLNTQALTTGSTLRFYGLVFNDNGTLRMDCGQVNDGVAFLPQSNSGGQLAAGQTRIVRHNGAGALPRTTAITRSE